MPKNAPTQSLTPGDKETEEKQTMTTPNCSISQLMAKTLTTGNLRSHASLASASLNRPSVTLSDGNSIQDSADSIRKMRSRSAVSITDAAVPMSGEKPNDLLQRLYDMWPSQLTTSYRPNVTIAPDASADHNLRCIREMYPTKRKGVRKAKAVGVVVETVVHLDKKIHYRVNISRRESEEAKSGNPVKKRGKLPSTIPSTHKVKNAVSKL